MPKKGVLALAARSSAASSAERAAPSRSSGAKRVTTKATGEDRTAKRGRTLAAGVLSCARCRETSEAKKWALMNQTPTVGGDVQSLPVGIACEACWKFWEAAYKSQYEEFQKFADAYNSRKDVADGIDKAEAVWKNQLEANFNLQSVFIEHGHRLDIERQFLVVSESELRALFGVDRLKKSITKALHSIQAPSEQDPSTLETLYCFEHPEAKYRTARLTVSMGGRISGEAMSQSASCYASQGSHVLAHEVAGSVTAIRTLATSRLANFPSMLASHGIANPLAGHTSRRPPFVDNPGDGNEESDDEQDSQNLVGAAVASATSANIRNLSTPTKNRPQVPSFATAKSTAADNGSSPTAGLTRAGSATDFDRMSGAASSKGDGDSGGGGDGDDDMDSDGADVVSVWQQRLPLQEVMLGAPKGRTVKALRDKVARLAGKPETRDDANRLRIYADAVSLAGQLRKDKVMGLPADELRTIVQTMLQYKVEFALDVKVGLLDHRVAELTKRVDVNSLLEVLSPWPAEDGAQFDLLQPTLGTLCEMPMSARLSRFKAQFWSKTMAPLLMEANESTKQRIADVCTEVIKRFEGVDPLELDIASASLLQEVLCCGHAVYGIVLRSVDPSYDEHISHVRKRMGKTDKCIITSTANAIATNTFLGAAMDDMTKGRMAIMEWGDCMLAHEKSLTELCLYDTDGLNLMLNGVKDLTKAKSTNGAVLFNGIADKIQKAVTTMWTEVQSGISAGRVEVTPSLLTVLEQIASEATMAWSMDDNMIAMQSSVATLLSEQSSEANLQRLGELISDGWTVTLDDSFKEAVETVTTAIHAISSLSELPSDLLEKLNQMSDDLGSILVDGFDKTSDELMTTGLDFWDLVVKLLPSIDQKPTANSVVLNILLACVDLRTKTKTAEQSKEDMPFLEGRRVCMHELSVSIEKARQALSQRDKLKPGHTAPGVADKLIEAGEKVSSEFLDEYWEDSKKELDESMAKCQEFVRTIDTDPPWHSTVTGSKPKDWEKLVAVGTASICQLNTKEFEAALKQMDTARKTCASAVKLFPEQRADDVAFIETATQNYIRWQVLLRQALLMWHLNSSGTDHDQARKRVQAEIKVIRNELKLKEKDVLPEALFRKSWNVLSCTL